jgi:hypothetical protein
MQSFRVNEYLAADSLQILRELDPLFRDSPPHASSLAAELGSLRVSEIFSLPHSKTCR